MAEKSGSFRSTHSNSSVNEGWGIRVDWEQVDNSYTIKTKTYLELRQYWADLNLTNDRSGTTAIDGSDHNLFLNARNYGPGVESILIGEGSKNVGSAKTITISAEFNMAWNLRGYDVTKFSASDSITLKSIMESPNNPTGVGLSVSGKTLSASWSHSETSLRPVDSFEYRWSTNGGDYSSSSTTTGKTATKAGSRGNSYRFAVRAKNAAGVSDWVYSSTVSISYLAPNTPSLSSSQSGTTAELSWTITVDADEKPIDNFRIERAVDGGAWAHLTSPGSGTRAYNNTGLTRGSTYKYRIRAEGPGGDSGYSSAVTERIPYLPPNKPTNVEVSRSAYNRFVLGWSQAVTSDRPVNTFDIYRRVNGGSYTKIGSVTGTARSYNDNTVELGKTYQYYVKAINDDASTNSDGSNSLTNPAGVPVFDGSAFQIRPVYVFDGANWVHRPVYEYNGTIWNWIG